MPRGQTLTTSASLVANGLLIQEANTSLLFHENRHHHNRTKAAEQTLLHLRAAGQVPIIAVLKMHFLWIYSCCHPDQILCRPHAFTLQQSCPMGPSNQLIKKAFYSKKTWIFVPPPPPKIKKPPCLKNCPYTHVHSAKLNNKRSKVENDFKLTKQCCVKPP